MDIQQYHINFDKDLPNKIVREVFSVFPSKNLDNVYVKMIKNVYPPRWLSPVIVSVETVLDRPLHRYWLNIMPQGSQIGWHDHYKNDEVAVLYIQVPDNESPIEFKYNDDIVTVHPHSGLLIKFPGIVEHRVLENKNKDYRISIAFDLL